jgi:hypothetical protein
MLLKWFEGVYTAKVRRIDSVSPTQYTLEIYGPEGSPPPLVVQRSDTPFLAINIGDALNTLGWPELSSYSHLRVTDVEHVVTESQERLVHKIMIRTRVEETD